MAYVYEEAQKSLENTPNLLPVLKEVGVVDSGGKGLTLVYEGFLKAMKGEKLSQKHRKSIVKLSLMMNTIFMGLLIQMISSMAIVQK